MRVYVVGGGAVGRYLGEALAATGAGVTYAPRAIADVTPVAADLAIVAVKAYDTDAAMETLRKALGENVDATILTPQNGVGNEERLATAFGADRIVSCALTVPVEIGADGRVVAAGAGSRSRPSVPFRTTGSSPPSSGRRFPFASSPIFARSNGRSSPSTSSRTRRARSST